MYQYVLGFIMIININTINIFWFSSHCTQDNNHPFRQRFMGTGSYLYRFLHWYLCWSIAKYWMGAILFEETSKDIFSGGERSQLDLHGTFNTRAPWSGERYSSLFYVLETWIFICYSTLSYLLEHLDLLETWTLICENLEPWSIRAFKFYVSEQGKGLKPQSWNWSIMGSFPHSFSHSQLCYVCA